MKKILFIKPHPWYVEAHIEYLIRYFGGQYIMDLGYVKEKNPDDYDLLIPLLAPFPMLNQYDYQHKIAGILWEPNEGIWRETLIVAATTPKVVKSMQNQNHPYIDVAPGIDTQLFKPYKQAKADDLFHVGVMCCLHNPRHRVKEVILPLMDIPGVKFDFYARNYFPDRTDDFIQAGGQQIKDNIVNADVYWPGLPNIYNRMDVLLKVDADPGLTFPILEAAACGKPFIATDVGIEHTFKGAGIILDGEPDHDGNKRSWYVDPENTKKTIQQARDAIIYLRDNPSKSRYMGLRGRREVLKNWTWEKQLPKWAKFFREALKMADSTSSL